MLEKFNRKANLRMVQDSIGKNLTIALFKETNDGRTDIKPIWSIKDWKEVYLEIADPTEYLTAQYLIGDWNHWQTLVKSWGVAPYILEWRKELQVKLRAMAIDYLKKQAASEKGTTAAKWLAEQGYEGKLPKVKKAQEEVEMEASSILKDAKRMGTV